ncbi:MAG: hypothetical protein Kow0090_09910 [Myxococcota bacterium]
MTPNIMAGARKKQRIAKPQAPLAQSDAAKLYCHLAQLISAESFEEIGDALIQAALDFLNAKKALLAAVHPETKEFSVILKRGGELTNLPELLTDKNQTLKTIISDGENKPIQFPKKNGATTFFFDKSSSLIATSFLLTGADHYILAIEDNKPSAFQQRDILLFSELMKQAIPIMKQRKRLEESKHENVLLWDVKTRIREAIEHFDETDLPLLLKRILELALARTNTRRGVIMLLDEETGDLIVESTAVKGELIHNRIPQKFVRRSSDRASGIVFRVIDTNKPYIANDIEKDPNYVPLFEGILSTLAVPISFQNRSIGVVVVESRRRNAFTLEDQRALLDLSRSAATFIRRAQLYSSTTTKDEAGIMIRGLSPEWEEVERRVEKAAATDATVIIRGESGTGKELVAHLIHFNSPRSKKPFVVVNCAAIPSELVESELFGYKKGAFTGAISDRIGKIELADGGTLFLDEIGDLSPPLQVKLLRFLQNGEIQPVGSSEPPKRVDVRLLAATSRELEKMKTEATFREDLYYRLHVVPIFLPPLRSYKSSIPGMTKAFIEEANKKFNKTVKSFSEKAMTALMNHNYPGNVRELKNIVERAVILADGEIIDISDMPDEVLAGAPLKEETAPQKSPANRFNYKARKEEMTGAFERRFFTELLTEAKGNISEAAALAGIRREQLYPMLKRCGIDPAAFRE